MYNKFIHTCGRVFALHSGLKRGVRWGVFGFETLYGYHNPNIILAKKWAEWGEGYPKYGPQLNFNGAAAGVKK